MQNKIDLIMQKVLALVFEDARRPSLSPSDHESYRRGVLDLAKEWIKSVEAESADKVWTNPIQYFNDNGPNVPYKKIWDPVAKRFNYVVYKP